MKLYGGIDLHSNNSVLALLDEDERLVYRRRLPHDAPSILEALAPFTGGMGFVTLSQTFGARTRRHRYGSPKDAKRSGLSADRHATVRQPSSGRHPPVVSMARVARTPWRSVAEPSNGISGLHRVRR